MHPKVQGSMIHAANGRDASAQPRGDTSQMVVEALLPEIPACQNKGLRTRRSRQNTAERAKHGTAGTTLQQPTAPAVPCIRGAIGGEGGIHAVATASTVAAGMVLQSGVAYSLQHQKAAPDKGLRQMRTHPGGRRDEQSEKLLQSHAQAWCADRVASAGVATTAPRQWGTCHESSADCVLSDVAQRPQQCIQATASSEVGGDAVQLSPSPARSGRPQRRASQGVARLLKALQQPVGPVIAATPFRKRKRLASQTGRARLQHEEAASSQETAATSELHLQGRTHSGCHQAEDGEEPCEPPARKPRLGVSLCVEQLQPEALLTPQIPCISSCTFVLPSPTLLFMWIAQDRHTLLATGRVKKCSSKAVELMELGTLSTEPGWHNRGYIFPDGFVSRTTFRSSV